MVFQKHPDWDKVFERAFYSHQWLWMYDYIKSHDINQCTDAQGNTLLHSSVQIDNEDMRDTISDINEFLIDPNIKNSAGQTAFQLALDMEPRCLANLQKHHLCIDFDKASSEPNGLDALFAAIYRGDATLGDISGVKDDGNEVNTGGWTALQCAVRYDRPHLIRALHQRFPNLDADYSNRNEGPAIHLAAKYGHSNCIIALRECFPAIKAGDALHTACKYNRSTCIPTLHQCFPLLTGNELGTSLSCSALVRATTFNNPECIRALHSCFPDIDPSLPDVRGHTALMAAVEYPQNSNCIPVLFECFPNIDPNKQDKLSGSTALMYIIEGGLSDVIALFATCFPNTDVNLLNQWGQTALIMAIHHSDEKCVVALCKSFPGLDPNIQNSDGNTALMLAVLADENAIISQLHKFFPNINPNIQNEDGDSALILVAFKDNRGPIMAPQHNFFMSDNVVDLNIQTDNSEYVSMLHTLFPNIDPNVQNNDQDTALMVMLKANCNLKSLCNFLDTFPNVDINIQNLKGQTALTHAVTKDDVSLVGLLIERFPDIYLQQRTKTGKTVLMLAIKMCKPDMLSLLLKQIIQID